MRVLVLVLLAGALFSINATTDTLLIHYIKNNNTAEVKKLIDQGADINAVDKDSTAAIFLAANNLELIEYFAGKGADLHSVDKYGNGLLAYAAHAGNCDVIKFMLKNNGDVNKANYQGVTPIMSAVHENKVDAVKLLLESGASVSVIDSSGISVIVWGINSKNADLIKTLIEQGADVNTKTSEGNTALIIAASYGYKDQVELLLENGADPDVKNNLGYNACYYAATNNYPDLLKLLVDRGADPSLIDPAAVTIAARDNNSVILEYLLDLNVNPDKPIEKGLTALHLAARDGSISIMKALIEHGADVNLRSETGRTPAYLAAIRDRADALSLLYIFNADFSIKDNEGIDPLAAAKGNNCSNAVEYLEKPSFSLINGMIFGLDSLVINWLNNSSPDDMQNNISANYKVQLTPQNEILSTPLRYAVIAGKNNIAELILRKFAKRYNQNQLLTVINSAIEYKNRDILPVLLDDVKFNYTLDHYDDSPLLTAVKYKDAEAVKIILQKAVYHKAPFPVYDRTALMLAVIENTDLLKILLEYNPSINFNDRLDKTLLIESILKGNTESALLLINAGADVNLAGENGITPLHAAVKYGGKELINALTGKGGDINKPDYSGLTPVMAAAQADPEIFSIMFKNGKADLDAKNNDGQTILFRAAEGENLDAIELLVKNGAAVNEKDNEGRNAFLFSVFEGSIKSAELLLRLGSDPALIDVYGNTPLLIAERRGYKDIIGLLENKNLSVTDSAGTKPRLMVRTGHTARGFGSGLNDVVFSKDGKLFATSGSDNTVKIWHTGLGQEIYTLKGHSAGVISAAFSSDTKFIASTSYDNTMKLWETSTGDLIRTYKFNTHPGELYFSNDGRYIFTAEWGVKKIEISSGRIVNYAEGNENSPLALSKDGTMIAYFSGGNVRVADSETFKILSEHNSDNSEFAKLSFSPDNSSIWYRTYFNGLYYKNIADPGKFKKFAPSNLPGANCNYFSFDDNGNILVSAERQDLLLVDYKTMEIKTTYKSGKDIYDIYACSGKVYLLLYITLTEIDMQNMKPGKEIFLGPNSDSVCMYTFSPDGTCIPYGNTKNTIKLWDLQTGTILSTLSMTGIPRSIVYSPDGKYIAAASSGMNIQIWEVPSGKLVKQLTDSTDSYDVHHLQFSPDGRYLSDNHGGEITFYETSDWNIANKAEGNYGSNLNFVSGLSSANSGVFSPDSRLFITDLFDDGSYRLVMLEVPSGKVIRTIKGHRHSINYVSFSPDGKMLASCGSDGLIKIWDTSTGDEIRTMSGHLGIVYSVCFSPDGKFIASGGTDNIVRLWDVAGGKLVYSLKGHSAFINTVWFSPDGRYLASGAQDVTVKLWDWKEGKEISTLYALNSTDWAVLSPAGLFDASAGAMKLMHYMAGLEPIELNQLKERYFEPGLLGKLLGYNDEKTREVEKFGKLDLYPEVSISEKNSGSMDIQLKNRGGGIGKVVVYINGKEIITDARGDKADSNADEMNLNVDYGNHPFIKPGEKNKIEVMVYNSGGYLSSRGASVEYMAEESAVPVVPDLYLVSIGVSDYSGDQMDLKYAAKDAEDIAGAIISGAKRLFGNDKTYVWLLTTNTEKKELLPVKQNIINVFEEIARKASSEDIIVVYLSGHGVNWGGQDGDFFYLTADAYAGVSEAFNDPAIRNNASLSSGELTELIKKIPALKQVLLIDACASGRTVDNLVSKRDISSSTLRALDRMKDRVGMHIITGCAADAVSYEASRYGQGILTYCLLEGIKGSALREGQFIDINLLFQKTRERVPVVAAGIGGIQEPRVFSPYGAESFDIGLMTDEDKQSVRLAKAKPLILYASLQEEESMDDLLSIEKMVDEAFRTRSSKGNTDVPFIFIEAKDFPDAYRIRGQYRIEGDKVNLKINLFRGKEKVGSFSIEGNNSNLNELADNIVNSVGRYLSDYEAGK